MGNEAVLLFFVLSGFVLSLPAVTGKPQRYSTFLIRRVFRIYAPYLVALAASIAGAFWLHGIVTRSEWFHGAWSELVDWQVVWQHLLFLGNYDYGQFDNPIWSLVHEMRISLVFPFLCAAVLHLRREWALFFALGLSTAAVLLEVKPFLIDAQLANSLHYAAFFILGILLARYRFALGAWFSGFRKPTQIWILVAVLWLFLFAGPQAASKLLVHFSHGWLWWPIPDWISAFGASCLIIVSMSFEGLKRFLHWRPVHFLGEISYSLYLWHFIVMLYCVHLLYGRIPLGAILCLIFVLSLVVSWCSYRWIEVPCIAVGRRLGNMRRLRPVGAEPYM